jgi:hypothetical protein
LHTGLQATSAGANAVEPMMIMPIVTTTNGVYASNSPMTLTVRPASRAMFPAALVGEVSAHVSGCHESLCHEECGCHS